MTKLKGLLLTEGMHGMISQVEGLAKALDLDFIHEKIELNNFWKLIPPKITPISDFVFKNKIDNNFDVVISCGRKSVIPSLFLKKKFKDKIKYLATHFECSTKEAKDYLSLLDKKTINNIIKNYKQ